MTAAYCVWHPDCGSPISASSPATKFHAVFSSPDPTGKRIVTMEGMFNGKEDLEVGFPTYCAMRNLSPNEILMRVAIGERGILHTVHSWLRDVRGHYRSGCRRRRDCSD